MIFNGRDLLTFVSGISINKEIPPMMVGRALTVLDGAKRNYLGRAAIAAQTYTLKLNIHAGTMAAAWETRHAVAQWAYSETECPLIPTHEPSKYYNAICQSVGYPTFVFGSCTVDVVFLIPTPFMYSVATATPTGSGSLVVYSTGTYDPVCRLTITPGVAVTNPVIMVRNANTSWSDMPVFTAVGEFESGVPLVVDLENRTFMVNNLYANDKINYLMTDWEPMWAHGTGIGNSGNNSFRLYSEGSQVTNCALSAEAVMRWL